MNRSTNLVVAAASSLALLAQSLASQSLITDLAPSPSGGSAAAISEIVAAGGLGFFAATGGFGRELYVSDGTPGNTRMVKDLGTRASSNPGASSNPQELTVLGSEVLFTAIVEGLGRELWKSDGTAAGTVLVMDSSEGPSSGSPMDLIQVGSLVYFSAYNGTNHGLYSTDGTTAGTTAVFTVPSRPTQLTAVGSTIYFSYPAAGIGNQLWKTDGTPTGAVLVHPAGFDPTRMVPFMGGVLFRGSEPAFGYEPYYSDGTQAGTIRLADLHPTTSSNPSQFTPVGSLAVFTAFDDLHGLELFVTDGTPAGTGLLADINPGPAYSTPSSLTEYQGAVYFGALDNVNNNELWRTDGTPGGTGLFVNISSGSLPSDFVEVGGKLWFAATGNASVQREPWKTDGTVAGTQLVIDIVNPFSSNPSAMVPLGTGVLCSLFDPALGTEIGFIESDGSSGGVIRDIDVAVGSSTPDDFVTFPGGAFFTATSQTIGTEGFVTDGTAGGTTAIDVSAGVTASNPSFPVVMGSEVFFRASIGIDRELWKSDGTPAGTVKLTDIANTTTTSPHLLAVVNGHVVFRGFSPGSGFELWSSDGTPGGATMIYEFNPGSGSSTMDDIISNSSVAVFSSYTAANGRELWSTDGTAAGTFMIEINPGSGSSSPQHIVEADGLFYFSASAGSSRFPFVSDGTIAGTAAVTGAQVFNPFALTPSGSRVFGRGSITGMGQELFVADSTLGGTQGIDLVPGTTSSTFTSLTGGAGGAFFLYDQQAGFGTELWFSDGTLAGTSMVLDIAPGNANGPIAGTIVPILGGTQVAFLANDLSNGMQIWTSDGTAAGTVMASAFGGNGIGAAHVGEIHGAGAEVFFAGDDGTSGIEPWTLDTGNAFVLNYGSGCAASGQPVPQITSSGGVPSIGNAAFSVDVTNAVPNSLAPLFLGFAPANISLGFGCKALVQLPVISWGTAATNGSGDGSVNVPLPNDPSAIGASIYFQFGVLSTTGPFLGFLDLSNGLHVQVGS